MKRNLLHPFAFLAALAAFGLFSAGCAQKAAPASEQATSLAAAEKPAPRQPLPAAPAVPVAVETPPSVPAAEVDSAAAETGTFRISYWKRPEKPLPLFVRENGRWRECVPAEKAFNQVFRAESGKPVSLFVKTGEGTYEPHLIADPAGLKDFGLIILPSYDPKTPRPEQIQVLDCCDEVFPYGSIRIYNWTRADFGGEITFYFDGNTERREFSLKSGEHFVAETDGENSRTAEIRLNSPVAAKNQSTNNSQALLLLRRNSRLTVFVVSDSENPEKHALLFHSFIEYAH